MSGHVNKTELFATLPAPWPEDLRPQIRAAVAANPEHKIVVLDDDPTGTQTVYDVPVLTTWEVETLRTEFNGTHPCFYILTNSRSLPPPEARTLLAALVRNLREAARGRSCTLVSRSDSTLRGHFPLETDVLAEVFGAFDATFLIPYFEDGGRYTINDVHYIAEDNALIPAAETPFALDPAFGYRSSNLRDYIEEKSAGRVKAGDVASISLADLRQGGPEATAAKLLALPRGAICIINAAAPRDLDVFVCGALAAEAQGRCYCFRTAAQFPAARLGLEPQPLLTAQALDLHRRANPAQATKREWTPAHPFPQTILPPSEPHREKSLLLPEEEESRACVPTNALNTGGLVIVGSHVPKTTKQLAQLPCGPDLLCMELRVDQLLSARRRETLAHVLSVVTATLRTGKDVVVFTSRRFMGGSSATASLHISSRISDALVDLVQGLEAAPRYLVAKGGITSSDLATRGLDVKRALVLGQILPGVPAWRLGLETKFPGMPFIVFPGNVGGPEALATVIEKLRTDD